MGPLSGIRIIEAAMHHLGPAAGYMLGDLGASVIKIEPPITGDYQRGVQSTFDNVMALPSGHNAAFESANRNKRSIILDLRNDAGKGVLRRLIESSDVVITNFTKSTIKNLQIDYETLRFPFTGEVFAVALAESMAYSHADLLVWLSPNTIVLREPKDLLLQDGKNLGFRPVHHTLIGSRYDEPLDPFWTLIYHYCNVSKDHIFPMMTHIDKTKLRPYFNAGLLVTRPEKHLLQAWRDTFFKVYQEPSLAKFYRKDERYTVFLHQAVLTGIILSTFTTDEIQELPSKFNYPLHLHAQDTTDHRPSYLEELVTFRHEGFYEDSKWIKKIPAKEPLKQWITQRLRRK